MIPASPISERARPGDLWAPLKGDRVRCFACGHRCPIPDGYSGVCQVRFNRAGTLQVPFGYVSSLQFDPIEKKPFYHALPGARTLSFGMLGCSLHCGYCQNWRLSQAPREAGSHAEVRAVSAGEIARTAVELGAAAVISTYNEPLITSEWAAEVFRAARAAGLATGFVSNGNATTGVLQYLRPSLDLFKVDLKTMSPDRYRQLGGRLAPILQSIEAIHGMGFWLEVVTLLVPDFNDSTAELRELARFLAGVSPDIPWHVTAFHPDFKMTHARETPLNALLRAASIGRDAGLRYVYAGNLSEGIEELENTRCFRCGYLVIERRGFRVMRNVLTAEGRCPSCSSRIPGVWRRPDGHGG